MASFFFVFALTFSCVYTYKQYIFIFVYEQKSNMHKTIYNQDLI